MLVGSDGSHLHALNKAGITSELGISWSPTGRHIAYREESPLAIHVVDVQSGRDREIVPNARVAPNDPFAWPFAWRADGQAVRYFGPVLPGRGAKHEVREISLDGKDRLLTTVATEGLGKANFINDTLVEITGPREIRGISLVHGTVRTLYSGPVRNFLGGHVSVSSDGAWIGFSADEGGDNEVPRIVSLKTGESRRIPYPIGGEILHVMFVPNGRDLILSACPTCNAGYEKWEVIQVPMNGDPPRVLTAPESKLGNFGVPSISPDGRSVVFEADHSYSTRIVKLTLPKQ